MLKGQDDTPHVLQVMEDKVWQVKRRGTKAECYDVQAAMFRDNPRLRTRVRCDEVEGFPI
jgi:hypothetical protein